MPPPRRPKRAKGTLFSAGGDQMVPFSRTHIDCDPCHDEVDRAGSRVKGRSATRGRRTGTRFFAKKCVFAPLPGKPGGEPQMKSGVSRTPKKFLAGFC